MISKKFTVGRLILLFNLILVSGCIFPTMGRHVTTFQLSKSLYVERYLFWDDATEYLTDSVTFRKKIGEADEDNDEDIEVSKNNDSINVYKTQRRFESVDDTLERKTMMMSEILNHHKYDSDCSKIKPVFGINPIQCCNYQTFESEQTDDSLFLAEDQFHCGKEWTNVYYLTDSLKFRILLGFDNADSNNIEFSEKQINKSEMTFFKINSHDVYDTIKHKSFKLSELIKKGVREY